MEPYVKANVMHEAVPLTPRQLKQLDKACSQAAIAASQALKNWLAVPALMHMESVIQCPLSEAIRTLGNGEQPIGICSMTLQGHLRGPMLLTFDDASGLKLADYILGFPPGTSQSWGEVEISAAVESMNIIGSTYVSSIASYLSNHCEQEFQLLPSPPEFGRDYAGALLQSAFLEQVFGDSLALFTQARFELSGTPVNWTFLFIPDADSFQLLAQVLENLEGISELPQ